MRRASNVQDERKQLRSLLFALVFTRRRETPYAEHTGANLLPCNAAARLQARAYRGKICLHSPNSTGGWNKSSARSRCAFWFRAGPSLTPFGRAPTEFATATNLEGSPQRRGLQICSLVNNRFVLLEPSVSSAESCATDGPAQTPLPVAALLDFRGYASTAAPPSTMPFPDSSCC